jgi:antitoxin VapB
LSADGGLKQQAGGKVKSAGRWAVGASPCGNIQLLYIEYSNLWMVAMSLYIRDAKVNELADEVMRRLGTKTKTEAVRVALENELKRADKDIPLAERVKKYQRQIAELGPRDPNFDEKAFMDEMWEY